jgi:hypothetical protein
MVILHIGAEKTGTTTIQEFLSLNRERLLAQGIYFPSSVGLKNHTRLAICAAVDKRGICRKAERALKSMDLEGYRVQMRKKLEKELADRPAQAKNVLFSSEHFHSQLQSKGEVERLRSLLPSAEQVKIVLYIRRQDQAAVSLYSTALKAGSDRQGFSFPDVTKKAIRYRYDYLQAYQLWSSVFGPEALVIRIFDKEEFVNGDLLQDFCFAAGIPWSDEYEIPAIKNPSLDVNGEFVFQHFNQLRKAAVEEYTDKEFKHLKQVLVASFMGKSRMRPARMAAKTFFQAFRQSNTRLKQLAFPGREAPLFRSDFSDYPLKASDTVSAVDAGVISSVLLKAWLNLAKVVRTNRKTRAGKAITSGAATK